MSVSISNLFNFSKTLPEPFNTLASKKVKVSSKYGSGTESTLCATVIKAIHAVCCHFFDQFLAGDQGIRLSGMIVQFIAFEIRQNEFHFTSLDK